MAGLIAVGAAVHVGEPEGSRLAPRIMRVTPTPDRPTCPGANRAIGFYRAAYAASRSVMGIVGLPARRWWGCNSARRRAVEWRQRALQARIQLKAWLRYQYDWRSWLPRNWYEVGSCETGYGGDPNWSHANRSFVSAFGITRANYAIDARAAGTPQWDDTQPPTPREQYETALAHYRMHGDGWGCPGP